MAERTDLTTLELMYAIAEAVVDCLDADCHTTQSVAAEAVARVMDANGVWFCRLSEHADGTRFEQMEMFK